MNKGKFESYIMNIFQMIFLLAIIWIIILNIGFNLFNMPSLLFLQVLALVLIGYVISSYLKINIKHKKGRKKRNFTKCKLKIVNKLMLFALFLLIFFIIASIGLSLRVGLENWDFATVYTSAFEYAKTGNLTRVDYFGNYPNNDFIFFIVYNLCKLMFLFHPSVGVEDGYKFMIIINSLIITISIFMIGKTAKREWKLKNMFLPLFLLTTMFPILFFSEFLYTDTLGLFFISTICYLVSRYKSDYKKISILFCIAIFCALGYKIKAFAIIIFVALIISIIVKKISEKNFLIKTGLTLGASFFSILILMNLFFSWFMPITNSEREKFEIPLAHWVAMGLNTKTNGGFFIDDLIKTRSIDGYKEKEKNSKTVIKERVRSFGKQDLFQFLFVKKMSRTWTSGDMFTDLYALWGTKNNSGFLQKKMKDKSFERYFQFIWGMFLIIVLISGFFIPKGNIFEWTMQISIIGLIIFLTLWETNPRYLYCFIPVFYHTFFNSIMRIRESILSRNLNILN